MTEQLMQETPAARPCLHQKANHQHGTINAYRQDRCRCAPCRRANSDYEHDRRTAAQPYGRWSAWLDARPVRAHVEDVMRITGVGWRSIAARAGLRSITVRRLLYGVDGGEPATRLTRRTAEKLYAIPAGSKSAPRMELWSVSSPQVRPQVVHRQ